MREINARWKRAVLLACLAPAVLSARADAAATCSEWVGKAVSVQGPVQALRGGDVPAAAGDSGWRPVKYLDTFCPGDRLRIRERGRADILLANETLLRLDQNTSITFSVPAKDKTTLVDLVAGAAYFITRTPKRFRVHTPFVNAGVDGTEFFVRVEADRTRLSVFEGRVTAENENGRLALAGGQHATADAGKPPVPAVVARPRDAVLWTLYYPPVFTDPPGDRTADTAGTWQIRVSRLLAVGRLDEASAVIDGALGEAPGNADALALRAVVAVAQNDKETALALARKAAASDNASAPARIALAYAQQADFDLEGALGSLREAARLSPADPLVRARLAELHLSFGDLDAALAEARAAAASNPDLARTQTVLGFAFLAQFRTKAARAAFERAIVLDQADPLPRLGLGLATIRDGALAEGRREIEIAASLDTANPLVRSYLGKAYHEEKRDAAAAAQLETAKALDPNDPTPFFYDAIRKQTQNRPVEALHDLQRSIGLNDNRAVYRSRLLLDADLAARSASLGRIYEDLGFRQLALVEGWKSVNTDPANHSAHRFLADSYAALPRHEIARVSELLQAQLLQPVNITPLQPHLAQGDLGIPAGSGPAALSFNEYNPLFERDRVAAQASGVAGSDRTLGDEIVLAGVRGRLSWSLGQFHFETDGFRTNNERRQDIYNAFIQGNLSHKASVQAELRATDLAGGDPSLQFFPDDFFPNFRQEADVRSLRLGGRITLAAGSDVLGSFLHEKLESGLNDESPFVVLDSDTRLKSYVYELQHLLRRGPLNVVAGAGYFKLDEKDAVGFSILIDPGPPPVFFSDSVASARNIRHANVYLYSNYRLPRDLTLTAGASGDFVDNPDRESVEERNQFNPKLGITWVPRPGTTLRAAAFRALGKALPSTSQTLEPTQVAGFAQFFDDDQGTSSWRYGLAADRKFSATLHGGAEYAWRDLEIPIVDGATLAIVRIDGTERAGRGYLYWIPGPRLALSAEYLYERMEREADAAGGLEYVRTHRIPLGANYHSPSGMVARLTATHFDQKGAFERQTNAFLPPEPGSDAFWTVDAALGYRLPRRLGFASVEGKNLFDESFRFKDTDPANPAIRPKRSVFFKVTLAI